MMKLCCDGCGILVNPTETKGWVRAVAFDGSWSLDFHASTCATQYIETRAAEKVDAIEKAGTAIVPVVSP